MRGAYLFVTLSTALLVVGYSSAAHAGNLCNKTRFALVDECEFFAKRSVARVYAEPDLKSRVITDLEWVYRIRVQKEDFEKMPNGWVRHSTDKPGFTNRYTGWVPVNALVDSNELKQVKACWPIKRVSYSEGDSSIDVLSRMDGRYYDARDTRMTKPIGHIYFAQTIVLFSTPMTRVLRAEMKDIRMSEEQLSNSDFFPAGFDPKTHELFPDGYKPDDLKVEYHSAAALKDCKGIVTRKLKKD